MVEKIETIIIGGGQGGLATSYSLKQRGHEHIVLEKAEQAGSAWRNDRWDSFTLLTPNWAVRLPGAEYRGDAPEGFMGRAEILATFEDYVECFQLPVRYGVRVRMVEPSLEGRGYLVQTDSTELQARNVVVATGLFQKPKLPSFTPNLPAHITQIPSGKYRNPGQLPPGAVLVAGTGQSGVQIAEELYRSGRTVYLCTSSAGRVPRRYRGKDVYEWMYMSGFLDRTVDKLPSASARFLANPQVTGRDGGRNINLHQFARDGVILLGHLQGTDGDRLWLAPDRNENLAKADKFEAEIVKMVDGYIAQAGISAPLEGLPVLRDGYKTEEISELSLSQTGITTIIWAMGYTFDFGIVQLPIFDGNGYPIQKRGVTDQPGLYFVGLPWLYKYKSGHLLGVGEDANYIASGIASRAGEDK